METPSVDISKLRGILGNAKKVMEKANALKPIQLSENSKSEYVAPEEAQHLSGPSLGLQNYNAEMVMKSNLPDNVKKLMMDKPIQQLAGIPSSFSAQDIYNESDEKEMPLINPKRVTTPIVEQAPKRMTENYSTNSDMITISKSELGNLINEHLLKFFTQSYNKKLTEDAITKTIKTLISEGRLPVKK